MDLSIVTLNWNANADTIDCLTHISGWSALNAKIWVVDNASEDDNPYEIKTRFPDINLIRNAQNEGFSGGTNRGVEAALKSSDAPILLLNNDAFIAETDLIKLWKTLAENPNIGIVGPLLFNSETSEFISAGGKNPVRHFKTRVKSYRQPLEKVHNVSGTVALIRASVFKTVGLLDEDFFFSTEMADFCVRAKKHRFESVINTKAKATHTVSRSAPYRQSLYTYYIIRNRFLFLRRHYPHNVALFAFWVAYSIALAAKTALTGERATARAVWLGLADGMRGRFGNRNALFLGDV